jgi:hypothetical protein
MRLAWLACAALTPLACAIPSAQQDTLAIIVGSNDATRAELLRVARLALDNVPVTLADDAFTRDSELAFERSPGPAAAGRALDGRILEMPERLRLVIGDGSCALIRISDGARFALERVRCLPR